MSANNWTTCPRCLKNEVDAAMKRTAEISASYGKVSAAEYLEMVQLTPHVPTHNDLLREDYELGIRSGEFSVSYLGRCTDCGFQFKFTYKEKVKL